MSANVKLLLCGFTLKTTDRASQPNFTSPISTYREGKASIRHLLPRLSIKTP